MDHCDNGNDKHINNIFFNRMIPDLNEGCKGARLWSERYFRKSGIITLEVEGNGCYMYNGGLCNGCYFKVIKYQDDFRIMHMNEFNRQLLDFGKRLQNTLNEYL